MNTLEFKIVKNARENPNQDEEPLKCEAKLVWEEAVLSDGSKCDAAMLDKLLNSVYLEEFAPPLLINHEWNVRNVVGVMTSISLDNGVLTAEFDVTDKEAQKKILEGTWQNVSITYDLPDFNLLECSLVAIPAIPGAKISAKAEEAEQEVKEEEPSEEPEEAKEAEQEEEPADNTEEEKAVQNDGCSDDDKDEKKKELVENGYSSELVMLKKQNENLQKQVKELSDLIVRNEKKAKCEGYLHKWISNGRTLPANKEAELNFILSLDDTQLSQYADLKEQAVCNANVGKRISQPVKPEQTRTEAFLEGYKQFLGGKA